MDATNSYPRPSARQGTVGLFSAFSHDAAWPDDGRHACAHRKVRCERATSFNRVNPDVAKILASGAA